MKPVAYHPDAWREMLEAALYYDEKRTGFGDHFLDAVEAANQRIRDFPLLGNSYAHGTRRWLLKKFPYQIVYREKVDCLQVVAVSHFRRKPNYWAKRL